MFHSNAPLDAGELRITASTGLCPDNQPDDKSWNKTRIRLRMRDFGVVRARNVTKTEAQIKLRPFDRETASAYVFQHSETSGIAG
ncbi:hypothetical protein C0Q70_17200 [Pomacea canaliculata]|uniref:Uncharacterized protein n=1 Tax=Pomacea canaliculata TaxID=400727 RepID=A0A2T7NRW7_POMCA|nr:hypothetical protein C0Q70_17200 [Pomacea canaliculata]